MYFSDLIEIKRIVLVMSLRKIRTSFDCVKYLNLLVFNVHLYFYFLNSKSYF